jgi:hypothetical protein
LTGDPLEFIERGYEKSAANSGVMISRAILLDAAALIGTAAVEAGTASDARKSHLTWLRKYLLHEYSGAQRDDMMAQVNGTLRQEFPDLVGE